MDDVEALLRLVPSSRKLQLIWQGCALPYVTVEPVDGGLFHISVDGRFVTHRPVSMYDLENFVPVLANAMAISAGFSCHGTNGVKLNPHARRTVAVSGNAAPPNFSVIDGGAGSSVRDPFETS